MSGGILRHLFLLFSLQVSRYEYLDLFSRQVALHNCSASNYLGRTKTIATLNQSYFIEMGIF
jgi:hypothetical protein